MENNCKDKIYPKGYKLFNRIKFPTPIQFNSRDKCIFNYEITDKREKLEIYKKKKWSRKGELICKRIRRIKEVK